MSNLKKVILQYAPDYNSGRAEVVLDGEDFVLGHSLGGAAAQLVLL